ncbi:MAG: hypothetical protein J6T08_01140 [Lentisphaeria bacterium]|nr:hypothetical protein [Lentisphaeria bacterium]
MSGQDAIGVSVPSIRIIRFQRGSGPDFSVSVFHHPHRIPAGATASRIFLNTYARSR